MIELGGADMIETTNMILAELSSYANPKARLSRLVKKGIYIQIVRERYETDRDVPRHLLAGSIYGPSYISFAYALGFYGMIPEAVYAVTSATFEKRKNKKYQTPFGVFLYRDVPFAVFPLGIRLLQEGGYFYRIAEPEKALCDQLYIMPPTANTRELSALIFDDLRVEETAFQSLSVEKVSFLAQFYRSTNIRRLATLLRRRQKG